jgi:hypothetical protein
MSNPAFRFGHVHIISENPRASADWYVEMFGHYRSRHDDARRAANLR